MMRVRFIPTCKADNLGFTLLEVMIALAILSLVIGGILTLLTQQTHLQSELEMKTLASIVAENTIIEELISTTRRSQDVIHGHEEMGGILWAWELSIQPVPGSALERLEVHVLHPDTSHGHASYVAFRKNL